MSPITYFLDENVDPALRVGLQCHWPEIEVWAIGDPGAPERSTPDPDILLWCEANGFTLLTNNRASMPVHLREHLAAGRHIPGIFILSPSSRVGETIIELALIWATAEPDEYLDQLKYLPVN